MDIWGTLGISNNVIVNFESILENLICNKEYLVFLPFSSPNPCNFLTGESNEVRFVMLTNDFQKAPEDGNWLPVDLTLSLESWNVQFHPTDLQKWEMG